VTAAGSVYPVAPRQNAVVTGLDPVSEQTGPAPPPGEFDQWCAARDQREAQLEAVRYVPRDMVGYEDLDAYGSWRMVPPYGMVWVPGGVATGWAPYHSGHWAWVDPWGWTWIDDAPWGFAPFHYGRWGFAGYWFWIPGQMMARPVYAPALVAFVGGPGFGMSAAFGGGGGVAWFALGPGEPYRPVYRVSPVYLQAVNARYGVVNVNVTTVNYVNRGVPGAVIAVPQTAFVGARPVATAAVRIDARELEQARVIGAAPAVAPVRASVLADPEGRHFGTPARYAERPVVARVAPPPPPVAFAARQQALAANPGRPVDPAALENLRRANPAGQPTVRTMEAPPPIPARPAPQGRPNTWQTEQAAPNNRPPQQSAPGFRPPASAPATIQRPAQNERPASTVQSPAQARPATAPAQQNRPKPAPRNQDKREKKQEK